MSTWSPVSRTVLNGLGGMVLLEKVCQSVQQAWRFQSTDGIPSVLFLLSTCRLRCEFAVFLALCLCSTIMDSHSLKPEGQLKAFFSKLPYSCCFVTAREKQLRHWAWKLSNQQTFLQNTLPNFPTMLPYV